MNRIKSQNYVPVYEVSGSEKGADRFPDLCVESHWNIENRVVLKIGDENITVIKKDLIKAIENAANA